MIVCPNEEVTDAKEKCINTCIKAFENKGIKYIVLYSGNATYANMAFCLTELPIKYLYFVGDGDYQVGGELRTVIGLSDGPVVSYCGEGEKKTKSIQAMGIPEGKLKIVFFDACYSGRLQIDNGNLIEGPSYEEDPTEVITDVSQSDMSDALGIKNTDQIYKGWYDLAYAFRILTYYNQWSFNFWKKLGGVDGESSGCIYEAVDYCIWHTEGANLKYGPHYNYRFKGVGGDMSIRLTN